MQGAQLNRSRDDLAIFGVHGGQAGPAKEVNRRGGFQERDSSSEVNSYSDQPLPPGTICCARCFCLPLYTKQQRVVGPAGKG